jgi:hypothetical protein
MYGCSTVVGLGEKWPVGKECGMGPISKTPSSSCKYDEAIIEVVGMAIVVLGNRTRTTTPTTQV